MTIGWRACAVAVTLGLVAGPAWSGDFDSARWGLRGFGTLGATYHDAEDIEYRRNIQQASGAEAGRIDFGTDSRAGLQLEYRLNSEMQFVAQEVARLNSDNNWRPRLGRAFARYMPDESIRVRLGRIGYDVWLMAESPDVGFSYLPVRPAIENFGVIPADEFDGLDVTFTRPLGSALLNARLIAGRTDARIARADRSAGVTRMDMFGGHFGYSGEHWHARLALTYLGFDTSPEYGALADVLRVVGNTQTQGLISTFSEKRQQLPMAQLAFAYDGSPLTGQLVLTRTDGSSSLASNLNSLYFLGGYRHERWTPFVSFASVKSFANVLPTGLPDSAFGELNFVARLLQVVPQVTQRTTAAGVRYDIGSGMDVKFQVDRVRLGESSVAFDRATPPRSRLDLTVLGVSFDFVF